MNITMTILLVLCVAACGKKDDNKPKDKPAPAPEPTKPQEPAKPPEPAEPPPSEPQPACAADAFVRGAEPNFCINLKPEIKPDGKGESKRGDMTALVFEGPSFASVQVLIGKETEEIAVRNMKSFIEFRQKGADADQMVAKGRWHGGYFFHTRKEASPPIHHWEYITTGPKGSLKCIGSAYEKKEDTLVADVEAACKSLQFK
jgi:hypothetical protein